MLPIIHTQSIKHSVSIDSGVPSTKFYDVGLLHLLLRFMLKVFCWSIAEFIVML